MEALRKDIAKIDFTQVDSLSKATHKKICALLQRASEIEALNPTKEPLPLEMLRYAAYHIALVDSKFIVQQTPDFLDLLTTIESHRQHNIRRIEKFLPAIIRRNSVTGDALTLRAELEELVVNSPAMRDMFLEIVMTCCRRHLYEIWLTKSNTEFWIHWNDYFPSLSDAGPSPRKFHHNMSQDELDRLVCCAMDCKSSFEDLVKEASDVDEGQSITEVLRSKEFRKQHEFPGNSETLAKMIKIYVDTICAQASAIEEALTPNLTTHGINPE